MRTHRVAARSTLAAVAAVAVWALFARPAAAVVPPGPWQGPVSLVRESGVQFSSVGTALAADGRGLIVWATRRPQFSIAAADVAPDGTAGPPVTLSAPADHAAAPLAGMAADGEAIVAWRTGQGARGVSVCVRPAAGGECAVRRLSSPRARAVLQGLAVAPDGRAVVAWVQRSGRTWRAAVSQREPGGTFGSPRLVGPAGAAGAQVALGAGGDAALAYHRAVGRRGAEVRLSTWRAPGAPGPARLVSPAGHVAASPRLAVDEAGDLVVAWDRILGRNEFSILHTRVRSGPQGALAPVRRLGPARVRDRRRQASTGSAAVTATAGRLVLTWVHLPAGERDASSIRVAQWSAGTLGPQVTVSDPAHAAFDPQVAAAAGRTVVAYREYGRAGVRDGLAVATVAEDGDLAFGPLAGLSDPTQIQQSAGRPRLAIAPSGAALATFVDYGDAGGEVAYARLPSNS